MAVRYSRVSLFTVAALGLPAVSAAFFAWQVYQRVAPDGLTAVAEGHVVLITLPDGTVHGGLPAAHPQPLGLSAEAPAPDAAPAPESAPAPDTPPEPAQEMLNLPLVPTEEGAKLQAAPAEAITEQTDLGPLPRVASGVKAWHYYARPAPPEGKAQVAVVVVGLGLSRQVTEQALRLAPDVSLSFSPYAADTPVWAAAARAVGHEVLVDLPLEPEGFPAADPGPQALLTFQAPEVNEQKLRWVLTRFPGYIGAVAGFAERFTHNSKAAEAPMEFLAERGLLLIVSGTNMAEGSRKLLARTELPYVAADVRVEEDADTSAALAQLDAAENAARRNGQAMAVVAATPGALKAVALWSEALGGKGIILAPVSALARLKFS